MPHGPRLAGTRWRLAWGDVAGRLGEVHDRARGAGDGLEGGRSAAVLLAPAGTCRQGRHVSWAYSPPPGWHTANGLVRPIRLKRDGSRAALCINQGPPEI
jgi:hypothetical protein